MGLHVTQDARRLGRTLVLLLVAQTCWMTVTGQQLVAHNKAVVTYSPVTSSPSPYGVVYGYSPSPYGVSPPPPLSPPPPPPPPTTVVVSEGFSTSSTVPAIKSTATLTNYATVAAFNSSERTRFVEALEANILKLLDVLANVTIDSVVASSVSVADTISFTGADSTAATEARDALVTALSSGDTSIFGTSFGTVTVSSVSSTNSTNTATKSGAGSIGWGVMGITAAVVVVGAYFSL